MMLHVYTIFTVYELSIYALYTDAFWNVYGLQETSLSLAPVKPPWPWSEIPTPQSPPTFIVCNPQVESPEVRK